MQLQGCRLCPKEKKNNMQKQQLVSIRMATQCPILAHAPLQEPQLVLGGMQPQGAGACKHHTAVAAAVNTITLQRPMLSCS
jgi:hypothetical protein